MRTVIVTPPATEPLELEDAKDALRIDSTEEDHAVLDLIIAARTFFEEETGFALIKRTLKAYLRFFPKATNVRLPYPPLVSVTSVEYYASGTATALAEDTNYYVDNTSRRGSLMLVPGTAWPTSLLRPPGVEIEYVAGFGDFAEDVPGDIRQCLQSLIAFWDDMPEAVYVPGDNKVSGKVDLLPLSAKDVIVRYQKEAQG